MLAALLRSVPGQVVLPLHPRTRARLQDAGLLDALAAEVTLTPPLGPLAFTSLLVHARAVLTDSGGVQKEAYLAGVPCVTLRDTTEWVETVDTGWNVLVDLDADAALQALERAAARRAARALRRRSRRRARRGRARRARGLTAADPQHRHREARRVEHAAPVDDRAGRPGRRVRAARGTPRGRPAGSRPRRARRPTA